MPRPLAQQVVVITGAGSGIGRETALTFASRGASVVVAARSQQGWKDSDDAIVDEHGDAVPNPLATQPGLARRRDERLGGRGIAVPADVSEYAQVEALAGGAVATGPLTVVHQPARHAAAGPATRAAALARTSFHRGTRRTPHPGGT